MLWFLCYVIPCTVFSVASQWKTSFVITNSEYLRVLFTFLLKYLVWILIRKNDSNVYLSVRVQICLNWYHPHLHILAGDISTRWHSFQPCPWILCGYHCNVRKDFFCEAIRFSECSSIGWVTEPWKSMIMQWKFFIVFIRHPIWATYWYVNIPLLHLVISGFSVEQSKASVILPQNDVWLFLC